VGVFFVGIGRSIMRFFCCLVGLFLERFLVELEELVERLSRKLTSERCRVLIPKETCYSVKRALLYCQRGALGRLRIVYALSLNERDEL
jgi:hypothetical protein